MRACVRASVRVCVCVWFSISRTAVAVFLECEDHGEGSTNQSPPVLFFFKLEIISRTPIPLFRPGSVHYEVTKRAETNQAIAWCVSEYIFSCCPYCQESFQNSAFPVHSTLYVSSVLNLYDASLLW